MNAAITSVCIVIVNFRSADLVIDCLRSMAEQPSLLDRIRVIVVDNASGDGSVEKLTATVEAASWSRWATVVPLHRNGGFAFGCNAGVREALKQAPQLQYVMFLNPDTVVHAGAVETLVAFLDSHQNAGIAGSRIVNSAGEVERSAHHIPTPVGELAVAARLGFLSRFRGRAQHSSEASPRECDWVSGASLIVRRTVLQAVGELDEGFFLYFEELDFCLRAQKAGWKVYFVPEACITHFEGAVTGITDVARRRPAYWYNSRRRYFIKHFGAMGLVVADILWAIGRTTLVLRRMLRLGSGGREQDPKWLAFDLLWGDFRALLAGEA